MATNSTTFSNGTVVQPVWLNDLNRSEYKDIFNVRNYGAVGDDTTDDTVAIQAAITAAGAAPNPGGGSLVYFPPGRYKVTQPLVVNSDQIYIKGSGVRSATIRVYHNLGPTITVASASSPGTSFVNGFGMQDISLRAMQLTTQGAHLYLNKVQFVNFSNVSFEDHFGGIDIYGGADMYMNNIHIFSPRTSAPVSWVGVQSGSFYFRVNRSTDTQVPDELVINNFNFRRTETNNYIDNGIVLTCVDGIWFSNGHIMGVANDNLHIEPVGGVEQLTGIKFDNVWFDSNSTIGVHVLGSTTASWGTLELSNCNFLSPSNVGIFVEAGATTFQGIHMVGGEITKTASYGVLLRAGTHHKFNSVDFYACNTLANANTGAITSDGANKISITDCGFYQSVAGTTASSMIGIRVNASAISNILVSGCEFDLDPGTLDISDSSTSDLNRYSGITTKPATATTLLTTSLSILEIGDMFLVTAGLNFTNMTGRWDQRRVTLVFLGASTLTYSTTGLRLSGSANMTFKAGDSITLIYSTTLSSWVEASRMIS